MADYRIRIYVDPSGAVAGSRTAERAVGRVGDAADRARQRAGGLVSQLRDMGGALKVAAVITAIGAYARVSDAVAGATGQLRLATRTQEQLNKAQRDSYTIAQKQGQSYVALATLYAKSTKAATAMGNEMDRALQLGKSTTSAIAAGIKVSGTSSQAAAAGVFQLSQALASGTLRGDELNSVMENIPAVGDAIAKAMGRSAGELRAMGAAGELTSKAVIEALEKAQPELEKMADMLPVTFGQAFQRIKNAATRLFTDIGNSDGPGFGKGIIAAANAIGAALDVLADNASTVANVLVGILVAAAVKAAVAHIAAGAAARKQAADNLALAASAVVAAKAQQAQAIASLAVARANGTMGAGTAAQAAAQVAAANRQLALTRTALAGAQTASTAAAASAGLFGRAMVAAASLGRAALAAVGGPIGLVIAGLVAVIAWAGKAALSFKPIAGEAATVSDYVMEAFSQMGDWIGKVAGKAWEWMKSAFSNIGKYARVITVGAIDAFLGLARAVAGVGSAIVAAFKEAAAQVGQIMLGIAKDGYALLTGDYGNVGATVASAKAAPGNVMRAAAAGYQSGSSSTFAGVTGEGVVRKMEALPGQILDAVMGSDLVQGLREGANERARLRAQNSQGGAQDPGNPITAADKDDKANKAAKEKKKTFEEIIADAEAQVKLAGMLTAQQEVQNALTSAQADLERGLTDGEEKQLTAVIKRRQQAEANLRLDQQIAELAEQTVASKMAAAAEEARMAKDYGRAAQLEAEIKVQEILNQAKRDGLTLDAKKVEAYRQAATLAAQEAEVLRVQQEAKRALQEIADNARKAMQSAVSDGIYAALSGDIKGVGNFFKTVGQIMRRQMAETITAKLFGIGEKAKVDSARVTRTAIDITTPAAQAVTSATTEITTAMSNAAQSIQNAANTPPPISEAPSWRTLPGMNTADAIAQAEAATGVATATDKINKTLTQTQPQLERAATGWVETLASSLGPLGSVVAGVINSLARLLGLGGGSGAASGSGLAGIKLGSKNGSATGLQGAASRALQGAQTGMMVAGIGKMLGIKTSSTGGAIGGAIGSAVPIPGGQIIGSIIGSLVGGLFKKAKTGAVNISADGVSSAFGNNKKANAAASEAGNTVVDRLREYAKALGGSVGSFGNIMIGTRDGNYRVNATGTSTKVKKGAVDFGSDAQAALEYAVKIAIQRGALTGLSAGISAAIKSGAATVEEAIDFTQTKKKITRQALALVDPVAAAVADVDDEFRTLLEQYKKFGESTTDLEKVYLDQRQAAINKAMEDQLSGVRDFIAELKGGALGGASLTDRMNEQNKAFSAIEAAQKAGQKIDYDELNSVGRALIDATRELEGATPAFYAQVDRVMGVLEAAIANGGASNVSVLPSPIDMGNQVTTPIVSGLNGVTGAINDNFAALLAAMNAQSQAIVRGNTAIASAVGGGGSGGRLLNERWTLDQF